MATLSRVLIGSLVTATSVSGFLLASTEASADGEQPYSESYTKDVLIRVVSACTMDGTEATAHAKNIDNGKYDNDIGVSVITASCNDSGGFAIYAVGFTGNTEGNTKLAHGTNNSIFINTGTATSGDTSNWAMKLTTTQGDAYAPTIENGYSNFSVIPGGYTKVASYSSATSAGHTASFSTHYAAYISYTQAAGTYTGQVKYVMVHPSNSAAPSS